MKSELTLPTARKRGSRINGGISSNEENDNNDVAGSGKFCDDGLSAYKKSAGVQLVSESLVERWKDIVL